jgi:hypothetical protein
MLGWGHGLNASEHKEIERKPGTTETTPHRLSEPKDLSPRLIEKRTGREVRNGEGENQTSGTKAMEILSVHVSTICKDLSRQLDHRGC